MGKQLLEHAAFWICTTVAILTAVQQMTGLLSHPRNSALAATIAAVVLVGLSIHMLNAKHAELPARMVPTFPKWQQRGSLAMALGAFAFSVFLWVEYRNATNAIVTVVSRERDPMLSNVMFKDGSIATMFQVNNDNTGMRMLLPFVLCKQQWVDVLDVDQIRVKVIEFKPLQEVIQVDMPLYAPSGPESVPVHYAMLSPPKGGKNTFPTSITMTPFRSSGAKVIPQPAYQIVLADHHPKRFLVAVDSEESGLYRINIEVVVLNAEMRQVVSVYDEPVALLFVTQAEYNEIVSNAFGSKPIPIDLGVQQQALPLPPDNSQQPVIP